MGTEYVSPEQISEGDVIHDPAGRRWIRVREIRALDDDDQIGVLSFYASPDDRITLAADEVVERKCL